MIKLQQIQQRLSLAGTTCMAALCLLFAGNNVAISSIYNRRLFILIIVGGLAIAMARHGFNPKKTHLIAGIALSSLGLHAMLVTNHAPAMVIATALALSGLALISPSDRSRQLAWACLTYAVWHYGIFALAAPRNFFSSFSEAASSTLSGLFSDHVHFLGPSYSTIYTLLPFLVLAHFLYPRTRFNQGVFALGISVIFVTYQFSSQVDLNAFSQTFFQLFCLPACFLLLLALRLDPTESQAPPAPNRIVWQMVPVVACILIGLAFSTHLRTTTESKKRVLFLDNGFFDLKVPTFDSFGTYEGGLFGMVPRYLAHLGYQFETTKDDLTAERLEATDILVLTNVVRDWKPAELKAIHAFVENGGGLLVQGDHTDFMNSKKSLDAVLEPYGVRFNFDSGYPARPNWRYCFDYLPHPITSNINRYDQASISVGATLSIESPSYPIVIGKYGIGDIGDYKNLSGNYLGNYAYDLGERLGDVNLVAGCHAGKGKVLVFGDTSTFQNGGLAFSIPHMSSQVFQWLGHDKGRGPSQTISLLLFLIAAVLLALMGNLPAIFATTLVFVLGLAHLGATSYTRNAYAFDYPSEHMLLFDMGHQGAFSFQAFERDNPSALLGNTARNGYQPFLVNDLKELDKAKVYVTIAPNKPFSKGEIAELKAFMEAGGSVILASGYEQREGAKTLLNEFGLDLAQSPLGPAPIVKSAEARARGIQFVSAWPIVDVSKGEPRNLMRVRIAEEDMVRTPQGIRMKPGAKRHLVTIRDDIRILFHHKSFALAIQKTVGQGNLIVIGDSLFFGETNIETLQTYNEANIRFIKGLFEGIEGGWHK